jgi:hypothetical protein
MEVDVRALYDYKLTITIAAAVLYPTCTQSLAEMHRSLLALDRTQQEMSNEELEARATQMTIDKAQEIYEMVSSQLK